MSTGVHEDGTAHSHPHHDHETAHAHAHDEHEHAHTHADGTTTRIRIIITASMRMVTPAQTRSRVPRRMLTHTPMRMARRMFIRTCTMASITIPTTAFAKRGGAVHYGHGPAGAHAPGMSQARMVQIERDILSKNDAYAAKNRARLGEQGIFALNLVSSPGSRKNDLALPHDQGTQGRYPVQVIEGDQQTSFDADRIRATGAVALQINTGRAAILTHTWLDTPSRNWRRSMARCSSSRTSAASSARRLSISAKPTRWRSFPSPKARTSR